MSDNLYRNKISRVLAKHAKRNAQASPLELRQVGESADARIAELERELGEAEAVLAKLGRTADKKYVLAGEWVYTPNGMKLRVAVDTSATPWFYYVPCSVMGKHGWEDMPVSSCYSVASAIPVDKGATKAQQKTPDSVSHDAASCHPSGGAQ